MGATTANPAATPGRELAMILSTLKHIPIRAIRAFSYSLAGMRSAFIREEAFRLEVLSLILLGLALPFVPWPLWKKFALLAVFFLIPLAEMLNTAVEDLSDLVSPEYNDYIKNAKDKGSAAVLLAIAINVLVLLALILV
jgi:diacylglycerol kinase (ATP)